MKVSESKIDLTDRERCRAILDQRLARPGEAQLHPYQAKVRRWMDCAPKGALFLLAPLTGWRGEPFSSKEPLGPGVSKNLRRARERHGLHPITGCGAASGPTMRTV